MRAELGDSGGGHSSACRPHQPGTAPHLPLSLPVGQPLPPVCKAVRAGNVRHPAAVSRGRSTQGEWFRRLSPPPPLPRQLCRCSVAAAALPPPPLQPACSPRAAHAHAHLCASGRTMDTRCSYCSRRMGQPPASWPRPSTPLSSRCSSRELWRRSDTWSVGWLGSMWRKLSGVEWVWGGVG